MKKIILFLIGYTSIVPTASKHHFCVDEQSGCTVSVNIRCRVDATGESCLNTICDPEAAGFSYEKCLDPVESKKKHFMTVNQEECGSMPVTLRYKVCNRNPLPIVIDAERSSIMFQHEEVDIPIWKTVILGESCRLIKLKHVYDTCKKQRTTSMEVEAKLMFDDNVIEEHDRCSCFIQNKAKINIVRPDPEPSSCTSQNIFFTEFADPADGQGGRYIEIYAPDCAGQEITDRIKVIRYPDGSSEPSEKYISLKNRIVPDDGFLILCNLDEVNKWNGQVCDDIGSWIGTEPYANDTFAIASARFDGSFHDLEIIDVYGKTSIERGSQNLSGGRAFRTQAIPSPSKSWNQNAWDVTPHSASTKDVDPRQWTPSPEIVERQPSQPINQKMTLRRLSFFDESVLSPYTKCVDLRDDMLEAVEILTNITIDREAQIRFHEDPSYPCFVRRGGAFGGGCMVMMEMMKGPGVQAASSSSESVRESSFQTNNQVEGVDEADQVKSDGTHVFTAYGNQLVTFDALTGDKLSTTTIPTDDEEGVKLCSELSEEQFASEINCYETKYWTSIKIEGLLLHGDRLLIITTASGYVPRTSDETSILNHSRLTRVFVYDVSPNNIPRDGKSLELLRRKDLQGRYQTARAIGQYAHIVTTSNINKWRYLGSELYAWNPAFEDMDEEAYRANAYEMSLVSGADFVEKLIEELEVDLDGLTDEMCSQILKIAIMTKSQTDDFILPSFTELSVLDSLTQVHSLNLVDDQSIIHTSNVTKTVNSTTTSYPIPLVKTSTSAAFLPTSSYTTNVYASANKLVVAGESYIQGEDGKWDEHTVLLVYDLINATSVPSAVGDVPGSLLNQFSMDHYYDEDTDADYLRVATTSWARWGLFDTFFWRQTDSSESQVSVLKMPSNANETMVMVGNVTGIGKTERIYAARFLGDKAYVVTFRQTDPFYTLDMADPYHPKLVGELKIPGFSNYLHPVNEDLILGLGQMANETTGRTSGLQISLFNVSNFTDPQRIRTYTEGSMSYSNAQYEHKAFRYLPESKLLILPLYIPRQRGLFSRIAYPSPFFDGFVVYDVDHETKRNFSKKFQISHVDEDEVGRYCWSRYVLPTRSMVFNGTVVTMKRHSILKHLLDRDVSDTDFASVMDMTTIDEWLAKNGLNEYGDPIDTVYMGGTPLFNETTGVATPRIIHLLEKFPSRPWDVDMTTIDEWLVANGLNEYGDPVGTMYTGGTPLFDEVTGKFTPRNDYLLEKFPSEPWDIDMAVIDGWLTKNGLNDYGDPMDTFYTGGTPLFNEKTGIATPRVIYLLDKFPSKPWDIDMTKVDLWLMQNGLNTYGDPMDTMYTGGTPLFNEETGESTPRIIYLLEKFPSKPWDIDMTVIDVWLRRNRLNEYGDEVDTTIYRPGPRPGTTRPYYNETTGVTTPRVVYLLEKFPSQPWSINMSIIDEWLGRNQLNRYGDPIDTVYTGGSPLFNEATGESKLRIIHLLEKFPSKPWDSMKMSMVSSDDLLDSGYGPLWKINLDENRSVDDSDRCWVWN